MSNSAKEIIAATREFDGGYIADYFANELERQILRILVANKPPDGYYKCMARPRLRVLDWRTPVVLVDGFLWATGQEALDV